jgi:hypothetical protein
MKKIILIFSLFVGLTSLKAQTTITNSIFLAGGDTLERSITTNTTGVTITPPASNAQSWDMSFLTTDATLFDSVRFASEAFHLVVFQIPKLYCLLQALDKAMLMLILAL